MGAMLMLGAQILLVAEPALALLAILVMDKCAHSSR